ncbi:MAG: glycosyltransferase [Balneolaceae bacterium]
MSDTTLKLLVIGKTWPEPGSSAAGRRILQLMQLFLSEHWEILFVSSSKQSPYAELPHHPNVRHQSVVLNDSSFDELMQSEQPDVVLFDRFMTEEQFGWRVAEQAPDALRILDMEDLHCLRDEREKCVKQGVSFEPERLLTNATAVREISSMHRCDLSIVISGYEMNLLKEQFYFSDDQLLYIPFLLDDEEIKGVDEPNGYQGRAHFCMIGNFHHAPNRDSIQWLRNTIWPAIRNALPKVEVHIYGAYMPESEITLGKTPDGVVMKGRADSVEETLCQYRLLLAPLRFGAGLKGKLVDAMLTGTPSVTTTIGAEGMMVDEPWPGAVADDPGLFAQAAIDLYNDEEKWTGCRNRCRSNLTKQFRSVEFKERLMGRVQNLMNTIHEHRTNHFIGTMLRHHTLASHRYLSKWIEEKNRPDSGKI